MRGRGISAFLVPMDTPGIDARRDAPTRSACAASAAWTSSSTTCASAPTQLLGAPGEGFRLAMWALDGGRVAIAAQALGIGQAALDEALALREAARGVRPADRQLPGDPVDARRHGHRARRGADADVEGRGRRTIASRGRRSRRRWPSWPRRRPRTAPPTRRCRSSRRTGYRRGSVVERLFRDVRATEIYQGTSEVQRMVIAEHILGG